MSSSTARVWFVRLPPVGDPDVYARLLAGLDADERERAARFRDDAAWAQFVVGHALVRHALSASTPGVRPADWRFVRDARGKPAAAGGPPFSLSHTAGLAACAVSPAGPCGLDVERCDRSVNVLEMTAVLRDDERAMLAAVADPRPAFWALWTAKEAYAKACGLGVSAMREVRHVVTADGERVEGPAGAWRLTRPHVGLDYATALAAPADIPTSADLTWTILETLAR